MTTTSGARAEVLARISTALGRDFREVSAPSAAPHQVQAYRTTGTTNSAELVELLTDRLIDYNAGVYPVKGGEVAGQIAALLEQATSVVVPHDVPKQWLSALTASVKQDSATDPLSVQVLDSVDAVVTGATLAIADTGTICLAGPSVGRRAITLVPDHHVCVLRVADIVDLVPQATAALRERGLAEVPQTWVSGPSATVDIELERVKGVHGPRTLDVILVED